MTSIGTWWLWLVFFVIITIVLGIDLYLFSGRRRHHLSLRESFIWSIVWIALSLLFNLFLWIYLFTDYSPEIASQKGLEFLAAYLVEKSLSLDNVFVFMMIFNYFSIPIDFQRRLLFLGVLGAIVFRLLLIVLGIWLIHQFEWIFYLFGALLIYCAFKMMVVHQRPGVVRQNKLFKILSKCLPMTETMHGERFFVRTAKGLYVTPLFAVLIIIELSDLIFAVDSIPAVFGVTDDPYIAFTSNAFAVLGLRAMYFVLAHVQKRFIFLHYGVVFILCFIGFKMLLHQVIEVPVWMTLLAIVLGFSGSILASRWIRKK